MGGGGSVDGIESGVEPDAAEAAASPDEDAAVAALTGTAPGPVVEVAFVAVAVIVGATAAAARDPGDFFLAGTEPASVASPARAAAVASLVPAADSAEAAAAAERLRCGWAGRTAQRGSSLRAALTFSVGDSAPTTSSRP
jgi:hypothetical protein